MSVFRRNSKALNESLPFRLSNLVPNSKLELLAKRTNGKQVTANVKIKINVVDLPPSFSESLVGEFPNTTTIWQILKHFEKKSGINFTRRSVAVPSSGTTSGKIMYEIASVHLFSRSISKLEELNQSLASLGFNSGNSSLKIRFTITDIEYEQALDILNGFPDVGVTAGEILAEEDAKVSESRDHSTVPETISSNIPLSADLETHPTNMTSHSVSAPVPNSSSQFETVTRSKPVSAPPVEVGSETFSKDLPKGGAESTTPLNSEQIEDPNLLSDPRHVSSQQEQISGPKPVDSSMEISEPELSQGNSVPLPSTTVPTLPNIQVYLPGSDTSSARFVSSAEEETKMTQQQFVHYHNQIKAMSEGASNRPLMTKALRESEEAKKLSKIKNYQVRVRLPDQTQIESTFYPDNKASSIYDFVRSVLKEDITTPFALFTSPPKVTLDPQMSLLWDYKFSQRNLVYLEWNGPLTNGGSTALLKDKYLSTAKPISEDPGIKQDQLDKENQATAPAKPRGGLSGTPRWLKMGRK
ncbi:hypothetical protein AWJ20_2291 [Sugiyamaella lignohabitans]|uniref:UBX domain-containing protein n=1 Tax=Sugiyamaella lignohabitans TaxID=796027 RepID=A0A167F0W2_9ASCO|nr:uncharacterized protein AWJ20_2291 [Sugiyamaella lignohabitans]ANB14686.1 hypothetical protein AWJ20_2291 [Sugiyamaella lignohabitans]